MSTDVTAEATVQIDDENVRVTEWRFAPGTQTGEHTHEFDYVVVPLTGGTLQVHSDGEVAPNDLVPGRSYTRRAGSRHNVVNESDSECAFVEIELKRQSPAG
ncbi:MAG: cupin domain-containing protein [Nesterenkonia sp.]|nr:cupin domain-containing protein [Nesterenkonia sp.]